jgi:hypothetical protein
MVLFLTYNNKKGNDAGGAQTQRIVSIYALAKYLNINYYHTPIDYIDHLGLIHIQNNTYDYELLERWKKFVKLENSEENIHFDKILEYDFIKYNELINLIENDKKNINVLIKILAPYMITDNFPIILYPLKNENILNVRQKSKDYIDIAVHIRRGDGVIVYQPERLLPDEYYINLINIISNILNQQNIAHKFTIFSERPTKKVILTPEHHSLKGRFTEYKEIDENLYNFDKFNDIPNLEFNINTDPMETLEDMINANILITSISSFSYLAGLFNKNLVLYYPFWHPILENWLNTQESNFVLKLKKYFNI